MHEDDLSFDEVTICLLFSCAMPLEARFQMVAKQMELMGVDSTGMPLDPKAFTFEARPKLEGWSSRSTGSRHTILTRAFQQIPT